MGLRALLEAEALPSLAVLNIMRNPGAPELRAALEARFARVIDVRRSK